MKSASSKSITVSGEKVSQRVTDGYTIIFKASVLGPSNFKKITAFRLKYKHAHQLYTTHCHSVDNTKEKGHKGKFKPKGSLENIYTLIHGGSKA